MLSEESPEEAEEGVSPGSVFLPPQPPRRHVSSMLFQGTGTLAAVSIGQGQGSGTGLGGRADVTDSSPQFDPVIDGCQTDQHRLRKQNNVPIQNEGLPTFLEGSVL